MSSDKKAQEPVELTVEQAGQLFLQHTAGLVEYWLNESKTSDVKDKLSGLAFSILSTIDGSNVVIPGFKMIPNIAEEDNRNTGGTIWPDADIAGSLHERWSLEMEKPAYQRSLMVDAVKRFNQEIANFTKS